MLDKPGELSISYLISEFIYEINMFFATFVPSSLSQKPVTDIFHYYYFFKRYLNRAETAKLMSAENIRVLNKLFLDFDDVFDKSICEIMESGFKTMDDDISDISNVPIFYFSFQNNQIQSNFFRKSIKKKDKSFSYEHK